MSHSKLIVIVPRLPPAVDGLGDYGLLLAKQMRQVYGIDSEFIIGDTDWAGGSEVEGFSVHKIESRTSSALFDQLHRISTGRQMVLLHYVGYGYARRGCPIWLVKGLEKWVGEVSDRKIITMFHELYAFGPIWSSQFWTSPLQRSLAAGLVRLSDRCITSKKKYAEIISNYGRGKHPSVVTMPVFSNVGEPQVNPPLAARKKRLVVFGGRGPRERVYKNSMEALKRTCYELDIQEIYDIGVPLEFEIKSIKGIKITVAGVLSPSEISDILLNSQVGFFSYPTEYLLKSGIFAAYCAHGVLPVGVCYADQGVDQVEEGEHYWLADRFQGAVTLSSGQNIADNAYRWYQTHNLEVLTKLFSEMIIRESPRKK